MTDIKEEIKVSGKEKPRIGVYICHCGINIAGVIDVEKLRDYAATLPDGLLLRHVLQECTNLLFD
ncbi:MAG: hypothetical protein ACTSPH_12900 [Promethearchaeota archaeon]